MIGTRIKALREDAGMSQAELARKLSISRSSVNAWESGLSAPTAIYIIELAKLFHCSSDYLLGLEKGETINLSGLSKSEVEILYNIVKYFDSKRSNESES